MPRKFGNEVEALLGQSEKIPEADVLFGNGVSAPTDTALLPEAPIQEHAYCPEEFYLEEDVSSEEDALSVQAGAVVELTVLAEEEGTRLDAYLAAKLTGYTRSSLQKRIEEGNARVNGKPAAKNVKLKQGNLVLLVIPPPQCMEILPEDIPLEIVYEDRDLLVVNKPKGMVVHPAAGNPNGTLVNALLAHCRGSLSGINGVIRPGIVHRIDKNTSGLLIVAKNDLAHQGLAEQIKAHSFLREYEAVVYGAVKVDAGTVDLPIGRSKLDRKKMCVTYEHSRNAVTHYQVLARLNGFTHVRCRLETGRTHQIRVHMAALGHPVAGDDVYGPKKVIRSLNGQCLHAKTIGFVHPVTGGYLNFDSILPDYFQRFLRTVGESGTPEEW